MFEHTSGSVASPTETTYQKVRSWWTTRDASAALAVRNHIPPDQRSHFRQLKTAKALYDAVVKLYSSSSSTTIGCLALQFLFPELADFTTVADLITHLRSLDTHYRAAQDAEFLDENKPPMYLTLYFLTTHLPDTLRVVRDQFLSLDPTKVTIDSFEKRLLEAEFAALAVAASRGTPLPSVFEGCSPSLLVSSVASAAAVDFLGVDEVGAASALAGRRKSGKGKGGKGGGGGGGGGGGRSGGGGRCGGGGGGGGSGGSGGSGGGGGGTRGEAGGGGAGGLTWTSDTPLHWDARSSHTGIRTRDLHSDTIGPLTLTTRTATSGGAAGGGGGSGGGQLQLSSQQLWEWAVRRGSSGGLDRCGYIRGTGHPGAACTRTDYTESRCFFRLDDLYRAEHGEQMKTPDWLALLKKDIDVYACDWDVIHAGMYAMYAASASVEGGCYSCVPRVARVEAASQDAFDSASTVPRGAIVLPCPAAPSGLLTGLHLPSFAKNLVATSVLQDQWVTVTQPGGELVAICTDLRTGEHLATFTRRPGSGLYTLTTESALVAESGLVATSVKVAAFWSYRLLTHQTLHWHHRLGHPSLPRLRGMHSRLLVSGLPRSLPPLLRSLAPPCLPCVEGRQRAAPHSSSFPPTTAPSADPPHGHDYTRYTMVFPLQSKAEVRNVLILWIRAVRRQLSAWFRQDLLVLRLHSDRGGEYSSGLLEESCGAEGICQTFTLPASPQQNGIAERRIGLVMEVARTSIVHAAAPHFLLLFAVRYAAEQLNSGSVSPTRRPLPLCGGQARLVMYRRFGSGVPFRLFATPLRGSSLPALFTVSSLASLPTSGAGIFTTRVPVVFSPPRTSPLTSLSVSTVSTPTSVPPCLSRLSHWSSTATVTPRRSARLAVPPGFPPRLSSPPLEPVAVDSGAAGGGTTGGAECPLGTGVGSPGGGASRLRVGDAGTTGARGAGTAGAGGSATGGTGARRQETLSPERLHEWAVQWGSPGGGASRARPTRAGGAGTLGAARGVGGAAAVGAAAGSLGGGAGCAGAAGSGGAGPGGASSGVLGIGDTGAAGGTGGAGSGGASTGGPRVGHVGSTGTGGGADTGGTPGGTSGGTRDSGASRQESLSPLQLREWVVHWGSPAGGASGTGSGGAVATRAGGFGGATTQPQLLSHSYCLAPAPAPHIEVTTSMTARREPKTPASTPERREPETRDSVLARVHRPRAPAVPGTHDMTLRPSSIPQCVVLPSPPASSLPHVPNPECDLVRAAGLTVTRLLATVVTDPSFESAVASALVAELVDFAALCRLDYATSLLECLAAAAPHLASTLLCPEGDPGALDIPTPRTYTEAITGPYSSQWQIAMDAEMASWKSTGTYVDEVPPPGANIVDGMWIFRVKRPPGSPLAFKARYVAQAFSQREGVDFFQTFSLTPKMTNLRVLLHVAAQREYELHSLDFLTAFLQGGLHEAIWLRCPRGFTWSFPAGTQWSLWRPVYGLRQAPREWHDTLRTTRAALGFAPSTADPLLFLRTDTSLPPLYVIVYVDDLVFATADTEALTLVKAEVQERQTCTDLGELQSYLGLQITRDRARRTITLTQSYMVQQVLQRFDFTWSLPQPTPLSTGHSLSAPHSDESVKPSGPYKSLWVASCT
ncbi:unnamed protein product [Closterium sp. NIES-54]